LTKAHSLGPLKLAESALKRFHGLKVLAEAIQQRVKFSSRFTLKNDHVRKDSMRPGIVLASLLAQFCTWTGALPPFGNSARQ
jgi:hypothetical protein